MAQQQLDAPHVGACLQQMGGEGMPQRVRRDTLDDCIGCGCLSIDRCRLRNPFDKLAAQGPGSRRLWVKPGGC